MLNFSNLSLQRKQMLIIMLTSTVSLLLACAAFVAYDASRFRREMVESMSSLAEVVGNGTTAAIDFNKPADAAQTLAALRGEPNIVLAHVHTSDGLKFATYVREGAQPPPEIPHSLATRHEFSARHLHLFRPITQGGEQVGTIELVADLTELRERLWRYAGIAGLVLIVSLLAAFGLSSRLQKLVSDPILHLAQVARSVALEKDYSLRATKKNHDELGQLVDGFNEMLAQIQKRDGALEAARDQLEHRVEARTGELASSVALLNATLEASVDGILALDLKGNVTTYNQRFVGLWQFSDDAMARRNPGELVTLATSQLKDSQILLARGEQSQISPEGRQFDVLEFLDGRTVERISQPQYLGAHCVGSVITYRDITERKRAEAAVRESQALYYSLVEQLPTGVFRLDAAGRYVFANSWFYRLKGMTSEQILGKTPRELLADSRRVAGAAQPGDLESQLARQAAEHHEQLMRTGTHIEVEEEYPAADGKLRYLQVLKTPVFAPGGKVVGSQGIMFDNTERKEAAQALRRTEALYRSAIAGAGAVPYSNNSKTRSYVFMGEGIQQLIGYAPHEVNGALWGKIIQESVMLGEAAGLDNAEAARRVARGELLHWRHDMRVTTREGKSRWLSDASVQIRDESGQVTGSMGILQDITERKAAETELAYERDLLRALLDSSPDSIYFKDTQSRFLRTSKHLDKFGGLKGADTLVGKTDFDFFTEEHARPAFEDEQEIIRTGRPLIGKVEKEVFKDGREAWALTSKMPLRNKDGQIIGTFGISKDITGIKETEAKLEQVHKQLMETSRQAGMAEIATNVLHNVGNVLNSVNVSTGLIVEGVKKFRASSLARVVALLQEHAHDLGEFITTDSRGKHLPAHLAQLSAHLLADQAAIVGELNSLRQNVEHIKEIVAMQQSYAKFGGVKEIINVVELVEDSLRMHEGALSRHGVEVIREFELVPTLNVEKHKILQILVNLLRNAKHACQDSERADTRITVRVANGAGSIRISVTDNGVGILPENLTRIFNHGFTTRKDGHGFGLHSGALAAGEMGGSLTVRSEGPGLGATFMLELPCEIDKSRV